MQYHLILFFIAFLLFETRCATSDSNCDQLNVSKSQKIDWQWPTDLDSVEMYCWCFNSGITVEGEPGGMTICSSTLPITTEALINNQRTVVVKDSLRIRSFVDSIAVPDSITQFPPDYSEDLRILFLLYKNGNIDTISLINTQKIILVNHEWLLWYRNDPRVHIKLFEHNIDSICNTRD